MQFFEVAGRPYARFERLAREAGLVHAFSLRPLDVSMRADSHAPQRAARRRQMAIDLGLPPDRLSCCVQVHRPGLAVLRAAAPPAARLEEIDGALTDVPGVGLMTFSADCPLLLLYDPRRRAVGAAHASWRCTVASIAQRLVQALRDEFGCAPADLLAGVGPSAGPDQYEVKEDVYASAAALADRDAVIRRRGGRLYFDLWEANRRQLVRAGVPEANIEIAGLCTMTRTDLLYSYRREGPGCGHFGLLAGLRGETA